MDISLNTLNIIHRVLGTGHLLPLTEILNPKRTGVFLFLHLDVPSHDCEIIHGHLSSVKVMGNTC